MAWREIIGRVCKVFKGHTLFDCLDMTRGQLTGLFWESFRQEARDRLNDINNIKIANASGDKADSFIKEIEHQAHPFDPQADHDAGPEDFKGLKNIFGAIGERSA